MEIKIFTKWGEVIFLCMLPSNCNSRRAHLIDSHATCVSLLLFSEGRAISLTHAKNRWLLVELLVSRDGRMGLQWRNARSVRSPFTSEVAGSFLSENFFNVARTQCSTHVKRVSQHSAESRGFSPGTPVFSHREC